MSAASPGASGTTRRDRAGRERLGLTGRGQADERAGEKGAPDRTLHVQAPPKEVLVGLLDDGHCSAGCQGDHRPGWRDEPCRAGRGLRCP